MFKTQVRVPDISMNHVVPLRKANQKQKTPPLMVSEKRIQTSYIGNYLVFHYSLFSALIILMKSNCDNR